MFKNKITVAGTDKVSFLNQCMQTKPEFRRQIINGAIACIARQNGFKRQYPEAKVLEIQDTYRTSDAIENIHLKFKITKVNQNSVYIQEV